jgi:methyl-accepting chemotaxis protein
VAEPEVLERIDHSLARMDQHMVRGNEIMQRSNEVMQQSNEAMQQSNEVMQRSNEAMQRSNEVMQRNNEVVGRVEEEMRLNREFHARVLEDFREHSRQMILRVERIGRDELRELSRMNEELERQGAEQRDLREESRAQTRALLHVLDRLDRGPSPPAR